MADPGHTTNSTRTEPNSPKLAAYKTSLKSEKTPTMPSSQGTNSGAPTRCKTTAIMVSKSSAESQNNAAAGNDSGDRKPCTPFLFRLAEAGEEGE